MEQEEQDTSSGQEAEQQDDQTHVPEGSQRLGGQLSGGVGGLGGGEGGSQAHQGHYEEKGGKLARSDEDESVGAEGSATGGFGGEGGGPGDEAPADEEEPNRD